MACLEQRAVARASRRQNGYSKRDWSLNQAPRRDNLRAGTAKMMANCGAHVNNSNSGGELKDKLVAGELEAVEVANHGSGDAVGLEKFLG